MTAQTPRPNRRRKWLIAAAGLVVFLVIGWFVLTRGPVVKALVLPRLAAALHAEVTVGELTFSPFSGVDLQDVKLAPKGGAPLVEIAGVKVRYELFKLIGGSIALREIELDRPRFTVRLRAEGGSDLVDWLNQLSRGAGQPAVGEQAATDPLRLQIGRVTVREGTVRWELARADGARDVAAIEALELSVDQVRNGGVTEARLTASPVVEFRDPAGALVDSLRSTIELSAKVTLDDELKPGQLDGRLKAELREATGQFTRGRGLAAQLEVRGSLARLDELALRLYRGTEEVGRAQVTGGYDPATGSGAFDLGIFKLPPVLLELATAGAGMNFELADFSATNHIAITRGGQALRAAGGWQVARLVAQTPEGSTPALDITGGYDVEVDRAAGNALIKTLGLNVRQNGAPLADLQVARPFHFSWQGPLAGEAGSALGLRLAGLNLEDWRPLTGALPLAGVLAARLNVEARELGRHLAFDTDISLAPGELALGTNRVGQLTAALALAGKLESLRDLQLERFSARLDREGKPLVQLDGTGRVGLGDLTASVTTTVKSELASLTSLFGGLPLGVSNGTLTLTSTVNHASSATAIQGTLAVDELAADLQGAAWQRTAVRFPFEAGVRGSTLHWKVGDASVSEGGTVALSLSSSGQLQLKDRTGSVEVVVPLLDERLVNLFLGRQAARPRLRSAQASAVLKGELAAQGRQAWSLTSQSTNVVLVDAHNVPLAPPLGTRASLEIGLATSQNQLVLRRWEGQVFAAGESVGELQATGELQLDGRSARLNAKVTGVNEHTLGPLSALVPGDRRVTRAKLSAEASLDYEATRPSQGLLTIGVRDLEVIRPGGRPPDALGDLELRLRARVATNRIELTEGRWETTPTPGWSNRLDVTGWLDVARPEALRGDFVIRSPGFDLSRLYALAERLPQTTNEAPDMSTVSASVRGAEAATTPLSLPVDRLDVALDIRQLKLRELLVTNWLAGATVRSNALDLELFSLRLGDAPVNVRLQATNGPGAAWFNLAAEIEGLKSGPVVRTFLPDWPGQAEADLFAAVRLKGVAQNGRSLWPTTAGEIYVGLTNGNFQFLDRRWQNALRPVGVLLQTPELFSSPVYWVHNHVVLTNRTLALDRLTVISDAYVLGLDAMVPLSDDFTSTPIPRTPVQLYLNRKLMTRLGFFKDVDSNQTNQFLQLPTFMHLGGTIATPVIETDKLKLTGMTIGKAGDFIGGSAADVLKKTGGVTEALGGIVSGRKLAGTEKQDANVVSKGIEGVFNVVGGVLGGTGKAVEQGTGAVTGTKVAGDDFSERLEGFDWPRVFTNAPNALPPR